MSRAVHEPIPQALIQRLQHQLGLKRAAAYKHIGRTASALMLPRRLAAIVLAKNSGLNIARYATPEDFAHIRETLTARSHTPLAAVVSVSPDGSSAPTSPRRKTVRPRVGDRQRRTVWIVHGRNVRAAAALRDFLRALGLAPLEWNQAVARTRKGGPYVGDVLDKAFEAAGAVVVLLTPDDEARLRPLYRTPRDREDEIALTPQARPNVLFEAGMAFGRRPAATILVQLGRHREVSDIGGRHLIHLDNSPERRQELATRLRAAGCQVDLGGMDYLKAGDFNLDEPRRRRLLTRVRSSHRRRKLSPR